MSVLDDEREHRLKIWQAIRNAGSENASPSLLRGLGASGGAQGIWVDKKRTGLIAPNAAGVTVSLLHTIDTTLTTFWKMDCSITIQRQSGAPQGMPQKLRRPRMRLISSCQYSLFCREKLLNQEKSASDGLRTGTTRRGFSSCCLVKSGRLTNPLSIRTSHSR
jgi:hypothetical protein